MKKQEYIDLGITSGLSLSQIEGVLCQVLGISREDFFRLTEISSNFIYEVQKKFFDIKKGVPLEYATEKANFYGRDFFVNKSVLIPRNDTECLVKYMLDTIHQNIDVVSTIYIDVGTGSACIPVSIVEEMHPLRFSDCYACDISVDALTVAKKNIEKYSLGKIKVLESNLLEGFAQIEGLKGKNLCITANLPYIKQGDLDNMDISVYTYEPNGALFGGEATGFELYEKLIKQCFGLKKIFNIGDIHLAIEIGYDQGECSRKFLGELGLEFEYFRDNANIERVILIHGF